MLGEVDQIDSDADEIALNRQLAKHNETKEFYLKEPKTRAGIRTADITPHLSNTLTDYLKDNPPVEREMTFRYRNGDTEVRKVFLVFTTDQGEPMTREYLRYRWNRACVKADIKLTPHQLRQHDGHASHRGWRGRQDRPGPTRPQQGSDHARPVRRAF